MKRKRLTPISGHPDANVHNVHVLLNNVTVGRETIRASFDEEKLANVLQQAS